MVQKRSLIMVGLIIFLVLWTLAAANELFDYEQQKQAIENNIQNQIYNTLNRQQALTEAQNKK